MCSIPQIDPHPLKSPLLKSLHLWQIRKLLGGAPNEGTLSRYLNNIWPMPKELERKLEDLAARMQENTGAFSDGEANAGRQ